MPDALVHAVLLVPVVVHVINKTNMVLPALAKLVCDAFFRLKAKALAPTCNSTNRW
jgi:hypothetical protein